MFLIPIPGSPYSSPTFVTGPAGDQHRIFVVQQGGVIRVVDDGALQTQPFLTVPNVASGGERGLLSMAFAPDYAASGKFYVYYTRQASPDPVIQVDEFLRDATNPDLADPTSRRPVITIDHGQYSNHNGGQLEFGPDGYLYIGTGDGGAGGDPYLAGQDLTTLLGKILRIDPLRGAPYSIPPNNPYVNQPPALPEIYALGVRNPWRFSFDRQTGDFTLADVGQDLYEEIDFQPLALGGGNDADFGWSCREGRHNYNPGQQLCNPPPAALVEPVFEYPHTGGRCSITGGYVVRDTDLVDLDGRYVYGDLCNGVIHSQILQIPDSTDDRVETDLFAVPDVSSFGEDGCGHVYVADLDGPVYKIQQRDPPPPSCLQVFPNTLTGDVNEDFSIHLRDPDGNDLDGGTLPAGTYTVAIDDNGSIHNFHLFGDAVSVWRPRPARRTSPGRATRSGR